MPRISKKPNKKTIWVMTGTNDSSCIDSNRVTNIIEDKYGRITGTYTTSINGIASTISVEKITPKVKKMRGKVWIIKNTTQIYELDNRKNIGNKFQFTSNIKDFEIAQVTTITGSIITLELISRNELNRRRNYENKKKDVNIISNSANPHRLFKSNQTEMKKNTSSINKELVIANDTMIPQPSNPCSPDLGAFFTNNLVTKTVSSPASNEHVPALDPVENNSPALPNLEYEIIYTQSYNEKSYDEDDFYSSLENYIKNNSENTYDYFSPSK